MADEQTPIPATDTEDAAPQGSPIVVNAQYTKDLSFEVPGAPQVLMKMQESAPEMNINVEVNARGHGDNLFEVELNIRANCTIGEETGFILELVYAGLFTLNLPAEHHQPVLLIECPRLLFPFARNIIADVTRDGGFPPVMLGQVDFVAMYQQQLQAQGGGAQPAEGA